MPGKRKFEIVASQPGGSYGDSKRARRTTQFMMSRSLPFPVSKKTKMVYTYGYAQPASAAFDYFTIACNDMYDFDRTTLGKLGNKQPTFFDAILSSSGPYKIYYVESWETTWTVINMTSVPVRMYVAPALNVSSEVDSQTEAENFPGVIIRDITHNDGSPKMFIKVKGNVKDIYPSSSKDKEFTGTYGSSPTTSIFGTLCLASGDGTTALNCFVSVKHVFHVRLESQDAIVS